MTNGYMSKVLDEANLNIETLVDCVITMEKEANHAFCINPKAMLAEACDGDCDRCKVEFYIERRRALYINYKVGKSLHYYGTREGEELDK